MESKLVLVSLIMLSVGCNNDGLISSGGQDAQDQAASSALSPSPSPIPRVTPSPTPIAAPIHFIYVANNGDDSISTFGISRDGTGQLVSQPSIVSTGHGPTELKMAPSQKFLYCLNPLSNTLSQYSVDSSGVLTALSPRDIGVSNSSQFLAFDSSGYLWIKFSSGPQFVKYSLDQAGQLHFIATFGSSGLSFGNGYALSFGAYVYNINSSTNMIDVYNLSPMTLTPYSYSAGRNITSMAFY